MKKYIIIVVISFLLIGSIVYYFATRSTGSDSSATDFISKASEYLEDKQYSKALEQYKLAINADPSNTQAYLKAADIYILKSENDSAIELLKNGESTVANADLLHHKIGELLVENNDIEGALEYFEKANSGNPNNWQNTVDLVKVYSYYSDKKESSLDILRKISTDDKDGYGWKNYYLALLSTDEIDKAISYLEDASNNTSPEVKTTVDNFLEVAKRLKSDSEDVVQNNTLLAYEMIRAELYPYAIPLLETVISENDEYYAAHMYMGICYLNMNDLDKAQEKLATATTVDPDQIQTWVFLAQVYTMQNNQKDSIEAFEEALNLNKTNEEVRLDYAKTLINFGLYRQAKLEYQELIDLNTESISDYKVEIALIDLDHLEEYSEGLDMIKEVVEDWEGFQTADDSLQARALDTLGWAFQKNEQKDEALKYLKQALEIDPYLASAYYHLGIIYAEIKDFAEASINFERAIDLDLFGDIGVKATIELENLDNEDKS
ncbi:tetratricopeptide repeat protein [Patescibacteria group bacterium]